jgi:hypothetical protein
MRGNAQFVQYTVISASLNDQWEGVFTFGCEIITNPLKSNTHFWLRYNNKSKNVADNGLCILMYWSLSEAEMTST